MATDETAFVRKNELIIAHVTLLKKPLPLLNSGEMSRRIWVGVKD